MRLRLLGRLELERGGVSRRLPRSRKSRALLGYLAETREAHGRTWLCDLLWDGPADPRAALRWSLAKLRPLVDHPSGAGLVTQGDTVRLDTSGAFLDVTELERLLVRGLAETSTDALRAGRDLFRGTFLAGIELDGCYRFDAWLTARREAYRRLRSDVLAELLRRAGDDPEAALPLALDRLRVDPHREDAYLQVARILLAQARPDEAWMQLERARLMLEEGLGVAPSEELLALRRQLEARARSAP